MTEEKKIARLAGTLYLVVIVTGFFSLIYVPSQITVSGDPAATVSNIATNNLLFRMGIAAFLIKQVAFLLLPFALFKLLRHVHQSAAALMALLAVVSVPIALISLSNRLDTLDILRTFPHGQAQSQAMLSLGAYGNGLLVTTLFWGLWLLPFGYLVVRSGFLPKNLGVLLILGGLGYTAQVFWQVLLPGVSFPDYVLLPAGIGEIGICIWLLTMGVRKHQPGAA